jgi:hypothetical protein
MLLLGMNFTKRKRKTYPILKKLDGKQLYFVLAVLLFSAIASGANVWKDLLNLLLRNKR